MIKNIFFNIYKKVLFYLYEIYLKETQHKTIFPRNILKNVFKIYEGYSVNSNFKYRIAAPLTEVSIINIVNYKRHYEFYDCLKLEGETVVSILKTNADYLLPLIITDSRNTKSFPQHEISLNFNHTSQKTQLCTVNRTHYLPLRSVQTDIKITSATTNCIVGKPLLFNINKKIKRKIILHLFIDALSQEVVSGNLHKYLPFTHEFFNDGYSFNNCFAQSEWTLSSMSSIFTGKYVNEHLVYHPDKFTPIKDITIAQQMQSNNYTTLGISSVPRLTPLNHFDKGFDRFIMAKFAPIHSVLDYAIDNIQTFNVDKLYLFIALFDMHEAHNIQSILSQSLNNLEHFQFVKFSRRKPSDTYPVNDECRVARYIKHLIYLDSKLKYLYEIINSISDEITAVFHSDHGISFNTNTSHILGKEREKVPLCFKSKHTTKKIFNNIFEVKNVFNFLSDDIKNIKPIVPEVKFSITESIYPQRPYHIAVRSEKKVLFGCIPWEYLTKRQSNRDYFKFSYHYTEDESVEICKDDEYFEMILCAENHYNNLINNPKLMILN